MTLKSKKRTGTKPRVRKSRIAVAITAHWRTKPVGAYTLADVHAISRFVAKGPTSGIRASTDAEVIATVVSDWPSKLDDAADQRMTELLQVALKGRRAAAVVLFHAVSRLACQGLCSKDVVSSWWQWLRVSDEEVARAERRPGIVRMLEAEDAPLSPP